MVQVRDLTELKVEALWREVKENEEEWWGDLKQETLRVVRRLLESGMEWEPYTPSLSANVYPVRAGRRVHP